MSEIAESAPAAKRSGAREARRSGLERYLIMIPYAWLLLFFAAPFAVVVKISLSSPRDGRPPYEPVFDFTEGVAGVFQRLRELTFESYEILFSDRLYIDAYLMSLLMATAATAIALAIAYPLAYAMARMPRSWRPVLVVLAIAPFWTSFLIRIYAWIVLLKDEGLINQALMGLGVLSEPLHIFATSWAVLIGIVYSYLPFMVLPIYTALEKQDPSLVEAAMDLGAGPWRAFRQVTLPLSLRGIAAGCLLVFIPAVGEYVIPDLLGSSETLMIGRTLWDEFSTARNWPGASAVAVALLLLLIVPIMLYQRAQAGQQEKAA